MNVSQISNCILKWTLGNIYTKGQRQRRIHFVITLVIELSLKTIVIKNGLQLHSLVTLFVSTVFVDNCIDSVVVSLSLR